MPIMPTLLVHKGEWVAQTIQLQVSTRQDALALKYLRIQNMLNKKSSTQLDKCSKNAQRQVIRIATRRTTATAKAKLYNMYVLSMIAYYAPHLTSSLKDKGGKLDKSVQILFINISSNIRSFSTKLLYITKKMAGLGFKCPIDPLTKKWL